MPSVRCDYKDCDWKMDEPISTMSRWYGVPCPKCGRGQIINKRERRLIRTLLFLSSLGLAELDVSPDDANVVISCRREGDGPTTTVITATYREEI